MLEKAKAYGYKNAGFILDRGYFSEPNIKFMDANGYEFIIMVKGCKDLVSSLILEIRGSFEDEWENSIPYYDVSGITIKDYVLPKDERERYSLSERGKTLIPALESVYNWADEQMKNKS